MYKEYKGEYAIMNEEKNVSRNTDISRELILKSICELFSSENYQMSEETAHKIYLKICKLMNIDSNIYL